MKRRRVCPELVANALWPPAPINVPVRPTP